VDRALDVFWSRGFAASSLDDLCAAIGIARPSLYAAFGDKQALYLSAFRRFTDRVAAAYFDAMAGTGSFADRCLAYLRAAIQIYTSGDGGRGCFAVCTATTEATAHPAIRDALAQVIAAQDAGFTELLRRAHARGELAAKADPATLACLLSAAQQSIAVRARAGASTDQLDRLALAAVALVFGAPRKKRAR
jgi:AcrR family transcriptional regulator